MEYSHSWFKPYCKLKEKCKKSTYVDAKKKMFCIVTQKLTILVFVRLKFDIGSMC